nr:hypothetical protein [uncultured Shimia sp.]
MDEIEHLVALLHPHDTLVLREIDEPGSAKDLIWEAAMGMSVESLRRLKLIAGFSNLEVTDLGRKVLSWIDRI